MHPILKLVSCRFIAFSLVLFWSLSFSHSSCYHYYLLPYSVKHGVLYRGWRVNVVRLYSGSPHVNWSLECIYEGGAFLLTYPPSEHIQNKYCPIGQKYSRMGLGSPLMVNRLFVPSLKLLEKIDSYAALVQPHSSLELILRTVHTFHIP